MSRPRCVANHDMGSIYFELGDYRQAMACLQQIADGPPRGAA